MGLEGKYLYDGKEFDSLEAMPAEARKLYEKSNSDGLLDIYTDSAKRRLSGDNSSSPFKFEIKGRKYNNLDELPLEVKEKILDKLALLERQGLRLILNENQIKGSKQSPKKTDSTGSFAEAPIAEVSSAFKYKLILGLILLATAIFFIYIFISSYLKNQ